MIDLTRSVVILAAAVLVLSGAAEGQRRTGPDPGTGDTAVHILDVPFIAQSERLCGGAAAAMVLRYWGARGTHAEDFADLVHPNEGIRTNDLVADLRARNWWAFPFQGGPAEARHHLERGRPVITLIQVAAARFHYVVPVAWLDEVVLLHDPVDGPFQTLAIDEFDRAWSASGYWSLLVLPTDPEVGGTPSATAARLGRVIPAERADRPCAPLVAHGIALARTSALDSAGAVLAAAARLCPAAAEPALELAGVRFRQRGWTAAARLARRATRLDPGNDHAWHLLGSSEFLGGDRRAALDAWNRIGEPRVDRVQIEGLVRTRHRVATEKLGLAPGALLTRASLERADRRLNDLPAVQVGRVRYRPEPSGVARVEAAVVERPLLFDGWIGLAAGALRAAVDREAVLQLSSPTGGGERVTARWRWWPGRPRVAIRLAAPAPLQLPGVLELDGTWERESYGTAGPRAGAGGIATSTTDERRRAAVRLSDWSTGGLLWQGGLALDRWTGRGPHLGLEGAIEFRPAGDRAAIQAQAGAWSSFGAPGSFGTAALRLDWRSTTDRRGWVWTADATLSAATANAPPMLWNGAGIGQARAPLLRAHPLLEDGAITGDVLGRLLARAGLELQAWTAAGPVPLSVAGFIDAAGARHTLNRASPTPVLADAGVGLRLAPPIGDGMLRIDTAVGLTDDAFAVSAAWDSAWPFER